MPPIRFGYAALVPLALFTSFAAADDALAKKVDALVLARAKDLPFSPTSDDAEFLRRLSLDLRGRIPSADETRAFLADQSSDKRAKLVGQFLNGPDYPKRMVDVFHVMFMERLGEHVEWTKYLTESFKQNKPWDKMVREMLRADANNAANKGAAFFLSKRLENYGQNPVDYPALTRDIGRLFLGKNLQCAQCHDHLFIDEYKQEHFQGLFAFIQNVSLGNAAAPSVVEKPTTGKVAFMSVFKRINRETGPALPGGKAIEPIVFKKGEEYLTKPDPKTKTPGVPRFSTLALLSEQVTAADNKDFARNAVNRLWFIVMGRGLVHPLDLHHRDNPPSHPEVLDLLAQEFVAHKYDIKWLLRELVLTETYQRSSILPKGADKVPPESFRTAIEKAVSAEQLMASMLEATGTKDAANDALKTKFVKAFANPAREPEEEFNPSLRAALFILNDPVVLDWLKPKAGNLVDQLVKITDNAKLAEEIYLSILTRRPGDDEKTVAVKHLTKHSASRESAIGQLAWALLASTEFSVNH
jgi:hypothetical protein